MHGIIEGFYGRPWTWDEREAVCRSLAEAGMDTYVHAPKDDPLHRERWRDPYDDDTLERLASLAGTGVDVGLTVAPGLSLDPDSDADRRDLAAKVGQLVGTGVGLVGLLLDDLDPAQGLGDRHGRVAAELRERIDPSVRMFVVPLHYTGTDAPPYLRQLLQHLPEDVPVGWTGRFVVNDSITAADARAWSAANGGRRPLLWDNTPVNDALMADRLHGGPLRGRDPDLRHEVAGYLANPMVQAAASLPALLSAAAWLRGEDPLDAWRDAAGDDRPLLEGCDPHSLAGLDDTALVPTLERALDGDRGALAVVRDWFAAAERCGTGSLGDAVAPWVEQLRAEAAVGRVAADLLLLDDPAEAARGAGLLHVMWPPLRRGAVQVLGGRGALLPVFGQDLESRWTAAPGCLRPPASLVDALVAATFERLGRSGADAPGRGDAEP